MRGRWAFSSHGRTYIERRAFSINQTALRNLPLTIGQRGSIISVLRIRTLRLALNGNLFRRVSSFRDSISASSDCYGDQFFPATRQISKTFRAIIHENIRNTDATRTQSQSTKRIRGIPRPRTINRKLARDLLRAVVSRLSRPRAQILIFISEILTTSYLLDELLLVSPQALSHSVVVVLRSQPGLELRGGETARQFVSDLHSAGIMAVRVSRGIVGRVERGRQR